MMAEVHGREISRGQQAQGEDFKALDVFPLGVVIDET
jgi:hypothetical protein